MLDLKFIREHPELIAAGLKAKRVQVSLDDLLELDKQRRDLLARIDDLRNEQNKANDEIALLKRNKQDASEKISAMKAIAGQVDELAPVLKDAEVKIDAIVLMMPNIAHSSVALGGPEDNKEIRSWGDRPSLNFKPRNHIELAESLDIIDFKRGAKISGSNFILYKNEGALLERALFNFMLDVHTREHGYREVFPPVVVNPASMTATGQLPKMKEDMYYLSADDLYLIPTAEVPVTNIHRDEILNEEDLPICYSAYSACFRREAGSYGKDTRGLMRVHQFNKVELVRFVKPETSYDELERLLGHAEVILRKLNIPYRIIQLAAGDLSFAAAKCYDIEVYAAGLGQWLEASSCSNFEDFQARRAGIRYKGKETKKPVFVHTLNGSGVAMPRTMIAILENNQTPEGDIVIPEVIRPYMGGLSKISRR